MNKTTGVRVAVCDEAGPAAIYAADEKECPACGTTILTSMGEHPLTTRGDGGEFKDMLYRLGHRTTLLRWRFIDVAQRERILFGGRNA